MLACVFNCCSDVRSNVTGWIGHESESLGANGKEAVLVSL